jgi:hypothetical protein
MGYIVFLILVFLLAACAPSPNGAPAVPTKFPAPNATATNLPVARNTSRVDLTATQDWVQFQATLDTLKTQVAGVKSSTPTVTITSSPTPTLLSYPGKQVLIEYTYVRAGLGGFGEEVVGSGLPDLILYSDGELIIHRKKIYEKKLSVVETCSLLKNIEDFGYFRVVDNGESERRNNPLYVDLPTGVPTKFFDGDMYHIVVNGPNPKQTWVDPPFFDYLVPAMKEILIFLQYYQPTAMEEYQPDRLLLYISHGREDRVVSWMENKSPARWPEANIHLSDNAVDIKKFDPDYRGLYLTGDSAKKIYALFQKPYATRILVDRGQEFTAIARPILPNEHKEYFYFSGNVNGLTGPHQFNLPFQCTK